MKLSKNKSLLVILFLLFSVFVCNSQDKLAKKTVDNFLNDWLIKKDIKLVQKYFDKKLFKNKFLLSEGCIGKSEPIKQESIKFLQDITGDTYEKDIAGILGDIDLSNEIKKGKILSIPDRDKFLLTKISSNNLFEIIENDKRDEFYQNLKYIKSKFPSKDYLFLGTMIKIGKEKEKVEAAIYFIWRRDKQFWKIIQFGMVCQ